ncbi:MAG: substrate-binding domain-containing protein, partial [Armatimonadetes bacterium]|nr:substrate-binding domain-containing protein [Armatimonadota bacterium]
MTPRFASRGVLAPLAAAAVAAACLLLPGCPPERPIEAVVGAPAANTPRTPEEILAQAKREGEVCFYTSLADSEAQKIAQGFMREYPFLNCTVVRSGTFEIVRRLQSELDRNEVRADVLHVLDPGAFVALAKHGDLYRYESPQAKYYPPSMRSPGLWTACRVVVTTMAVRSAGGPSVGTWRDLMRLPHSVRIGIKDAQTSGSAYATYYMLREKYGYSFWEAIARRKPAVFSSENEMLGALKRREVDLLVGVMAQSAASEPAV